MLIRTVAGHVAKRPTASCPRRRTVDGLQELEMGRDGHFYDKLGRMVF